MLTIENRCGIIGVKEVTAFLMSIDNMHRPKEQIDSGLLLLKELLVEIISNLDERVRFRAIGNFELLPLDIRKILAEVIYKTQKNNILTVTFAIAYTSRHEITNACQLIKKGYENGELITKDMSDKLLEKCLYQTNPVDLVVRTSGVTRFSDFLMIQSKFAVFYFAEEFWPEFSMWGLLKAIFHYQRCYKTAEAARKYSESVETENNQLNNKRVENFLKKINQQREDEIKILLGLKIGKINVGDNIKN